jgi:hypothetical protein
MNIGKNRPVLQTFKPVTPKTLMVLPGGLTETRPVHRLNEKNNTLDRKKLEIKETFQRDQETLPEFMKEYVQFEIGNRKKEGKSEKTTRVQTTKPQSRKRKDFQSFRPQSSPKKENRESRVFRIYQPQVIEISPRSKFKIYSTACLTNTVPLKKVQKFNFSLNFSQKQQTGQTKVEESSLVLNEPTDYLKPAMTFGEKLWRLNEVSIFSMIDKTF